MNVRPMTLNGGATVATPVTAALVALLGGETLRDVALSHDQMNAVRRLYGFVPERPNQRPEPPTPPKPTDFGMVWEFERARRDHELAMQRHASWEDPIGLMQAGSDRNAFRHAEADGLRIVAWLAAFVERGGDPLKLVVQLAMDAGFDVDPNDATWASEE